MCGSMNMRSSTRKARRAGVGFRHFLPLAWALALAALTAQGDTVRLTNGNELHGRVERTDDGTVYLHLPNGRIAFSPGEIEEIVQDGKGLDESETDLMIPGILPPVKDLPPPADDNELADRYAMLTSALTQLTLHPEEAADADLDREDEYVQALGGLGRKVAPQLEEIYRQADPRSAPTLLKALNMADSTRGLDMARESLRTHENPGVRIEALRILGESNARDKTALVAAGLKDRSAGVRAAAVRTLAQENDPANVDTLADSIEDSSPRVRRAARGALERLSGGKSFETAEEWRAWRGGV